MKFWAAILLLVITPAIASAENAPEQNPPPKTASSETLEMISQRMRKLSRGLEEIPEPPDMSEKILIPDLGPVVGWEKNEDSEGA